MCLASRTRVFDVDVSGTAIPAGRCCLCSICDDAVVYRNVFMGIPQFITFFQSQGKTAVPNSNISILR